MCVDTPSALLYVWGTPGALLYVMDTPGDVLHVWRALAPCRTLLRFGDCVQPRERLHFDRVRAICLRIHAPSGIERMAGWRIMPD